MRVGLLAMPWRNLLHPSHQMATLQPYLRAQGHEVTSLPLYLDIAVAWSLDRYQDWYARLRHVQLCQEALYAGLLFPERQPVIEAWLSTAGMPVDGSAFWSDWAQIHETAFAAVDWAAYDVVVSLTNGVVSAPASQFLPTLYAARTIRSIASRPRLLVSGSDFAGEIGRTTLLTVDWLDGVINGEVERPLADWLARRSSGDRTVVPGVLERDAQGSVTLSLGDQIADLDTLPPPDYSAFFAHPAAADLAPPLLRVEGARGCWWDRSTTDPRLSCQFCNINVTWRGYRRTSIGRLVSHLRDLHQTYPTSPFGFTDTISWPKESADLYVGIAEGVPGIQFHGLEGHVSLSWEALYHMKRAGVTSIQFGIEALVPSLLARMNKGIGFARIVETLRTCAELGIVARGNLLLDYPGATPDDVRETQKRLHAITWLPPLDVSVLSIGHGSPAEIRPTDNHIASMANDGPYAVLLPDSWLASLTLMHKSHVPIGEPVDWSPIRTAVAEWHRLWCESPVALRRYYVDAPWGVASGLALVSFAADGTSCQRVLTGKERRLFLYCRQGRTVTAIQAVFGSDDSSWIGTCLAAWQAAGFMIEADDRFISLGLAGDDRVLEAATAHRAVPPAVRPPPRLAIRPNLGQRA